MTSDRIGAGARPALVFLLLAALMLASGTAEAIGAPKIMVPGAGSITLISSQDLSAPGETTQHSFTLTDPPAGPGFLEVTAYGSYEDFPPRVSLEGDSLGRLSSGTAQCGYVSATFPITATTIAAAASDGIVDVQVSEFDAGGLLCPSLNHNVRLIYPTQLDRLDFGSVFVGQSTSRPVTIINGGSSDLMISSITSSSPDFIPAFPFLTLLPGASQSVPVSFAPAHGGSIVETLIIASDDPGKPIIEIELLGYGASAPAASVTPSSLTSTLNVGDQEVQHLTLSNPGGVQLNFTINVHTSSPAAVTYPYEELTSRASGVSDRIARTFQRLASSPVPLTSLIEDPAPGTMYALETSGTGLYRHIAENGSWERLAEGPFVFDKEAVAAILGGKLYTHYTNRPLMGAYDLESGTWTTIDSPVADGPAEITSDGLRYLYVLSQSRFIRLDPVTGDVFPLELPTLPFESVGALRHFDGAIYVHGRAGSTEFLSYEIASDRWVDLPHLPATASPGAFIDPIRREYIAVGIDPGAPTYRYSIDSKVWSVSAIPPVWTADDGPSRPPAYAGHAYPTGFWPTDLATAGSAAGGYVSVDPETGSVPPGGSVDISVRFDATGLLDGVYGADIDISTNDPAAPTITVPATMLVVGTPDIVLSGDPITVESERLITYPGRSTLHSLLISRPIVGDGWLDLSLNTEIDMRSPIAIASADVEGNPLGTLLRGPDWGCVTVTGSFPLRRDDLASSAADGVVNVTIEQASTPSPFPFCSRASHTVRLRYNTILSALQFGTVPAGSSRSLPVIISNLGSRYLDVSAIVSDDARFTLSAASLRLPPGTEETVLAVFIPDRSGSFSGSLSIYSDDPDSPLLSVAMSGTGVDPPIVTIEPTSIDFVVPTGERRVFPVQVSNGGGSPLHFTVGFEREPPPAPLGRSGTFDWPSKPGRFLHCVIDDPRNGVLYGQETGSPGTLRRYVASEDRWETLASSRVHGHYACGSAILNGKLYTTLAENDSEMGVYDILGDAWTSIVHPLGAATANIASDGERYLYLVVDRRFVRFDPVSSEVMSLADPPFSFSPGGALRHLGGILYGHRGDGYPDFASYDTSTDRWTILPRIPNGATFGAAIDSVSRDYYAYGPDGKWDMYRYSISSGSWSTIEMPLQVYGSGLAWLPSAVPGVYVFSSLGPLRYATGAMSLNADRYSGIVPPAGATSVLVSFDPLNLAAGTRQAELVITSDDPIHPRSVIPLSLNVVGVPNLSLAGPEIDLEGAASFSPPTLSTVIELHTTTIPGGPATFEITAEGGYGSHSWVDVTAEGMTIGTIRGVGGGECDTISATFLIRPEDLAWLARDSTVSVRLEAHDPDLQACSSNRFVARLRYGGTASLVDFGPRFIGDAGGIDLVASNSGTATVDVASITAIPSGFSVSPSSFTLLPGTSRSIHVSFAPTSRGTITGAFTVLSNDPDTPVIVVPLSGVGAAEPATGISPESLQVLLPIGGRESRTITLTNAGDEPVEFAASVVSAAPPPVRPPLGNYQPLTPSPSSLACITADTAEGFIYAREVSGNGFLRYRPVLDSWERLAPAPLSASSGCVGAILSSRIYFVQGSNRSLLSVYDIGSGTWSTLASPLAPDTDNIASDGMAWLYVTGKERLSRYDPATLQSTMLAPLDLPYGADSLTGLAYLDGHLYGNWDRLFFASYSITLNDWVSLPPIPDPVPFCYPGTTFGASTDPIRREYLLLGYNCSLIYHYAVDSNIWYQEPARLSQGRIAWLPGPAPGYYVTQLSSTAFGRIDLAPQFLRIQPVVGNIPPHGTADITVELDAAGLLAQSLQALVSIETHDPFAPLLTVPGSVPVMLDVASIPAARLSGGFVTMVSRQSFQDSPAETLHAFQISGIPTGEATVVVGAIRHWFDLPDQSPVTADGVSLGNLDLPTTRPCYPVLSKPFMISRSDLERIAGDGTIVVRIDSAGTNPQCPVNENEVRLTYERSGESIDFGGVHTGTLASLPLIIENRGTEPLVLGSSAIVGPFSISPPPIVVAPGKSETMLIQYSPAFPGPDSGELRIDTNDPIHPQLKVKISGRGVAAPVIDVEPEALVASLPPLGRGVRLFEISNAGGGSLEWTAEAANPPGAPGERGVDAFGYRYRTSDEPGGPQFSWEPVSFFRGVELPFGGNDLCVPLPIGFDFPFYGRLYRSVNTCSNGYLSFTDMSQHPSNISFPAPAAAPLAAIAPFWDDLTVYYTNWYWAGDQDRLIVEYRHLRDSNGGSDLTFQVVLYRTGKILFNYLTMAGQVDSATIGIQNEDGTIGLTVAQDIPFAHYGLTIEFSYAPEWLKVEPAMGVSMPGESAEVEAGLDASALPEGDHHAFIRLVSNDPLKRRVDIPILLHVGEVALDYVHIAPNTVNLSSKGKAIRSTLQLPVQYDPHDVAVETVSINGTLFADPTKVSFADQNGDGIEEIVLRFNRRAFQAMMPVGKSVPVTITGEVRDTIWFRGSDTIRTIHPRPISMEEP